MKFVARSANESHYDDSYRIAILTQNSGTTGISFIHLFIHNEKYKDNRFINYFIYRFSGFVIMKYQDVTKCSIDIKCMGKQYNRGIKIKEVYECEVC